MKRIFLPGALVIIVFASFLLVNSCKKKENSPPTITLNGAALITLSLPSTAGTATPWHDPGYTATDPQDGNITSSVVVTGVITDSATGAIVNPNVKGTYIIGYSVTDKEGISAPARTRTINVVNDAEVFAGVYTSSKDTLYNQTATDTIRPFPVIITSDSTDNQIWITNFGGLDSTSVYKVMGAISGTSITIPVPQILGVLIDTTSVTSIISASIISAIAPTSIDIQYQWKRGSNVLQNITHYRR